MLTFREPHEISLDLANGSCVTIGNFDGVHKGHQKLISHVVRNAKASNRTSAVITFCPHPLRVLVGPHTPPFITFRKQKLDFIKALKVDMTLLLRFSKEMASLAPEEFVKKYLVDALNTKELVIGYDYSFGKGRSGNYEVLKVLGEKYGFSVERLEPVIINDAIVSSTRIRDMIKSGDVWDVKPLLGRYYSVRGAVIKGKDRGGKLLGFPTANIHLENEVKPATGVYAVWVRLNGTILQGAANIGYNPTFGNEDVGVEVHLFDFHCDIYDRDIEVHFVQRIRPEKKFSSLDELKAQIRKDVAVARRILDLPAAELHLMQIVPPPPRNSD